MRGWDIWSVSWEEVAAFTTVCSVVFVACLSAARMALRGMFSTRGEHRALEARMTAVEGTMRTLATAAQVDAIRDRQSIIDVSIGVLRAESQGQTELLKRNEHMVGLLLENQLREERKP